MCISKRKEYSSIMYLCIRSIHVYICTITPYYASIWQSVLKIKQRVIGGQCGWLISRDIYAYESAS